jgi:hypothetical protein
VCKSLGDGFWQPCESRPSFSLGEASRAVAPLLTRLNERAFRRREGSRKSLFDQLERPALRALPVERFQYGDWKTARVNIDYHVAFGTGIAFLTN